MSIIEELRTSDKFLSFRQKTEKELKDPFKAYRTLYFENLVDVRLCKKNGSTTLRRIWAQLYYNADFLCTVYTRKSLYEENSKLGLIENHEYLFRKGSYRIAVKRDPVKRALSTAKYILKNGLEIVDPSIDMIEELIVNASEKVDHHFLPQTYWLGSALDYDEVYDMNDLNKLIRWLEKDYPYKGRVFDVYSNVSSKKITPDDLSPKTIERIRDMYEVDYKNGWF